MISIETIVKREGFAGCRLYAPGTFSYYADRQKKGTLHPLGMNLHANFSEAYPWANCLVLLLYAYKPLPVSSGIPGYYIASNRSYHAAGRVILTLSEAGIRAERADIPIRELCTVSRIGTPCKNGLTRFGKLGTRVVCQAIAAALPDSFEALSYLETGKEKTLFDSACENCTACSKACPMGAIDEDGMHWEKCFRGKLESKVIPDEIKEKMPALFGCEICQYVCPLNEGVGCCEEISEAFDPGHILDGKVSDVLALVGKNMNKDGRIVAHTIIMAARRNRKDLLPKIETYTADPREGVSDAARWAAGKLRDR